MNASLDPYPHAFSSGQRRASPLRALATSPDLLVCDERSQRWMRTIARRSWPC